MNSHELTIADDAMGVWSALYKVFLQTNQQRCWVQKTSNVLNTLPKPCPPKVLDGIRRILRAETKHNAEKALNLFNNTWQDKYPKATLCFQKDQEELLDFYDFTAKRLESIRTHDPF